MEHPELLKKYPRCSSCGMRWFNKDKSVALFTGKTIEDAKDINNYTMKCVSCVFFTPVRSKRRKRSIGVAP
jgi:hypothetical protein